MQDPSLWLWLVFAVVIVAALLLDLVVVGGRNRTIDAVTALWLTAAYIAIGLLFSILIAAVLGSDPAFAYLTGYVIEKSLSIDNILVFAVIFNHFDIRRDYQHRVLFWGVVGALAMRGIFIFAGAALLRQAEWVIYIFGVVAIISGIRLWKTDKRGKDIEQNKLLLFLRSHLPITSSHRGSRFFVRANGALCATPLFVVLLFVEFTDLVFAIDSLPAIFGVTRDEFLIYTSNAFAILGMRALYFAIAGMMFVLPYLQHGLALLLVFIGVKMLAEAFIHIPVAVTLSVTLAMIAGSVLVSLWLRERHA